VLVGQVGDGGEFFFIGLGEERSGGVTMDDFKDPAASNILDEHPSPI
jgi:hypothetical protein